MAIGIYQSIVCLLLGLRPAAGLPYIQVSLAHGLNSAFIQQLHWQHPQVTQRSCHELNSMVVLCFIGVRYTLPPFSRRPTLCICSPVTFAFTLSGAAVEITNLRLYPHLPHTDRHLTLVLNLSASCASHRPPSTETILRAAEALDELSGVRALEARVISFLYTHSATVKSLATLDNARRLITVRAWLCPCARGYVWQWLVGTLQQGIRAACKSNSGWIDAKFNRDCVTEGWLGHGCVC